MAPQGPRSPERTVRQPPRASIRQKVVLAVVAVAFGLAVLLGVSVLAGRGGVESQLGDREFGTDASRGAETVAETGPIVLPDVAGGDQVVFLQHRGDDEDLGWFAFDAFAPGAGDDCGLRWLPDDEEFLDPCSEVRYRADGRGLTQYPVRVDAGRVLVDLQAPRPPVAP